MSVDMNYTPRRVRTSALTISLVTLMALGACATPESQYAPMSARNQIQVAETVERLELYPRPNGFELSARDEHAVAGFLHTYGRFGDGPLYINVPNRPNAGAGIAQTQGLISSLMAGAGLSHANVQTGQYHAPQRGPAPVVVSYRRLKSIPQDCRHVGNVAMTYTNQPYDGFGCSQNANLAAMVEDPRQLLEPYAQTSPDMQRRSQVYDKYILGENPASEQPERQEIAADDE